MPQGFLQILVGRRTDEELSLLKEASAESNQIWKAAGKPRPGPVFHVEKHVVYNIVYDRENRGWTLRPIPIRLS